MYKCRFTVHFERIIQSSKKKDIELVKAAKKAVDKILAYPELNDGPLKKPLAGKRKLRIGKYRVVFAICGECRNTGHMQLNDCEFCSETTDDTVVFFDVGLRGKVYGE